MAKSAKGTTGEARESKSYLTQRKISGAMICTFVVSLGLLSSVSVAYFVVFLEITLDMSVHSIFIAHTHSIVGALVQVKKNDFMLSQNELRVSR